MPSFLYSPSKSENTTIKAKRLSRMDVLEPLIDPIEVIRARDFIKVKRSETMPPARAVKLINSEESMKVLLRLERDGDANLNDRNDNNTNIDQKKSKSQSPMRSGGQQRDRSFDYGKLIGIGLKFIKHKKRQTFQNYAKCYMVCIF